MKKILYTFLIACGASAFAACSDADSTVEQAITAPTLNTSLTSSITDQAVGVDPSVGEIAVYFTAPIALDDESALRLTDAAGQSIATTVKIANDNLHVKFGTLDAFTQYTLSIPAGTVVNRYDPTLAYTEPFTLTFRTSYDVPATANVTPAATLTDPAASANAVKIYNYLRSTFGKKMHSATMSKYTVEETEAEWVYAQTGRYPAMHCYDFMNLVGKEYLEDYATFASQAEAWWNAGGIVCAMWHWRDPSHVTNSFYCGSDSNDPCLFDLSKIINADGSYNTSSEEYQSVVADIAAVKAQLQKLADKDIPVLWRPLHEAQGAWFWWGAKGAEPQKALWNLLRSELSELHNLIWVYTIEKRDGAYEEAFDWYPGNDAVDLVGMDIYPTATAANPDGHQTAQAEAFRFAAGVSRNSKIIALTECGAVPDPALCFEQGATWAYFMPWYGDYNQKPTFGENGVGNGIKYWQYLLTGSVAERIIDRSETAAFAAIQ